MRMAVYPPPGSVGNTYRYLLDPPGPHPGLKDHCPVLLGILAVFRRLPSE